MRWYERILLFGALVVLFLCGAVTLTYVWPDGWYLLSQYRDAVYWALIAAAGVVAFASWKDD
jgi:hypothetical protein